MLMWSRATRMTAKSVRISTQEVIDFLGRHLLGALANRLPRQEA